MNHRDHQKGKLYGAEFLFRRMLERQHDYPVIEWMGSKVAVPVERRFGDPAAVQIYVDKVLALNWVQAQFEEARKPVTVRRRKGSAHAHHEPLIAVIAVPDHVNGGSWALREIVVLHELAHHLSPLGTHHGPEFAQTFLDLVEGILGPEAGFLFRTILLDNGVRVS